MRISTRGRYGIRALLELAKHYGEGPFTLKDIARKRQISLPYLEHLISPLVSAGMVNSLPGVHGGIWLTRHPREITLCEVLQLLEGSGGLVDCVNNPGVCDRADACATRDVWSELKMTIEGFLKAITLQDLCKRQERKEKPAEAMYYI